MQNNDLFMNDKIITKLDLIYKQNQEILKLLKGGKND